MAKKKCIVKEKWQTFKDVSAVIAKLFEDDALLLFFVYGLFSGHD